MFAAWGLDRDAAARLLGDEYGASQRPASEVADEMEDEASNVWSPDGCGGQRSRELEADLRNLGAMLEDVPENEKGLLEIQRRIEELERERERLFERKISVFEDVRWYERLRSLDRCRSGVEGLVRLAGGEDRCDVSEIERQVREAQSARKLGEYGALEPHEAEVVKAHLGRWSDGLREIGGELDLLEMEIGRRQRPDRLDDICGQICWVEGELKRIRAERDRLMLLRSVVIEAGRGCRGQHLPDVLREGQVSCCDDRGQILNALLREDGGPGLLVEGDCASHPVQVDVDRDILKSRSTSFSGWRWWTAWMRRRSAHRVQKK